MKTIASLFLTAFFVVSCAQKPKTEEKPVEEVAKQEAPVETPEKKEEAGEGSSEEMTSMENENSIQLVLGANDQMQYDIKELRVKEGQKITLTLNHTGEMPKVAMGHNFVLLQQGVDIATFAQNAMTATDNGYIPTDNKDIIVHTDLIGGGESTTITFDAPAKGTYDYICSFPGHYGVMQGKFIVE